MAVPWRPWLPWGRSARMGGYSRGTTLCPSTMRACGGSPVPRPGQSSAGPLSRGWMSGIKNWMVYILCNNHYWCLIWLDTIFNLLQTYDALVSCLEGDLILLNHLLGATACVLACNQFSSSTISRRTLFRDLSTHKII